MRKRAFFLVVGVLFAGLSMTAAGCGDDGGGMYRCSYEQRRTDGCDGVGWGDWVYECIDFNSDDYYITPQEVCGNLTEDGLYCEAGCCIDYEHRSVDVRKGTCN